MEPQIFTLDNQILEAVLPEVAFPFVSDGKKHTIALVGGGGKTTLMYFLGDTYAKQNIPTLIATTTHIRMPEDGSYVTTMEAALQAVGGTTLCGSWRAGSGRKTESVAGNRIACVSKACETDTGRSRRCKNASL